MDEQTKPCLKCGAPMPETSMFCPTCGAKQTIADASAPAAFATAPAAPMTTPAAPMTTPAAFATTPAAPTPQVFSQQTYSPATPVAVSQKPTKKIPWVYLALTFLMLIGIGVIGFLYFSGNIVDFDDITFADDMFSILVFGLSTILVIWNISMRLLTIGLKRKTVVDVLQIITFIIIVYLLVEILIAGPVYSITTDFINNLFTEVLQHTIS